MNRKKVDKPYSQLTAKELEAVSQEFDEEFVADRGRALTPEMQTRWERAKGKSSNRDEETIAVRLEKALLDRCRALAKKKRLSRDVLIARGLRALLAAEGE